MRVIAALFISVFSALAPAWAEVAPEEWRFDVYLNDREIGYHNFTLTEAERGNVLESEARFKVKFLFFNAFQYDHENTEFWQDGCLKRISSSTDSNGKEFSVKGFNEGETFVVETKEGRKSIGECVMSFAYWNKSFLSEPRLLNPQTGEFVEIDIAQLDPGSVQIGDRSVLVDRYRLTGKGVDIQVAYAAGSGEWIALDSQIKGRTLSYRRRADDLADDGTAVARRAMPAGRLYE